VIDEVGQIGEHGGLVGQGRVVAGEVGRVQQARYAEMLLRRGKRQLQRVGRVGLKARAVSLEVVVCAAAGGEPERPTQS
jgi:hypothetical protein